MGEYSFEIEINLAEIYDFLTIKSFRYSFTPVLLNI